jgi:hypothetical protein
MSDKKYSLFDYANFIVTVLLGVLAIVVTVKVSGSADNIGRSSLYVTMASFLLDDSPKRQSAGVDMARWAFEKYPKDIPEWVSRYVGAAAQGATGGLAGQPLTAPSTLSSEGPASSDPLEVPTTAASETKTANHLFDAVGGVLPRLFIQVPDDQQRAEANVLRCVINHTMLGDQPIVAPVIQKVRVSSANTELRFLKKADAPEAAQMATLVQGIIGSPVAIRDLSDRFSSRADIKPRTYELWFPDHFSIEVGGGSTCTGPS